MIQDTHNMRKTWDRQVGNVTYLSRRGLGYTLKRIMSSVKKIICHFGFRCLVLKFQFFNYAKS